MKAKHFLAALFLCFLLLAPSYGEDIYENQLNQGIKNSDVYAVRLIEESRVQKDQAQELLSRAMQADPTLPKVYFEASRNRLAFSLDKILESTDYLVGGINAYTRNFWWSFTMLEALFFSLIFSIFITVMVVIVIRLFSDMPLMSHDMTETPGKTGLLFLVVILSLVSPLFFLAGILMLLGLHMRKTDKIVVYLFLSVLVLSPWIFRTASLFMNASISGKARAITQVNESRGNAYALSVLGGEHDYPSRFSYALALKRQGEYQAAADIFSQLAEKQQDPRAYVNLGNCFIGLNNIDEAGQYYVRALKIRPMASVYYNLSQISRDLLEFNKGDQYFMAAVALDRLAVAGYRTVYARHPNRLVADETLSRAELWHYIRNHFEQGATFNLSRAPLPVLSLLALGLAGGFFWLNKRLRHTAYRCRKCGAILCTKCEKHVTWGQMCPQCYGSLVKLEETDVRERVARLLDIYEKQNRRRGIMKILSVILPGAAFIYGGKIIIGTLLLWPFLFFLMIPVMSSVIAVGDPLMAHDFINISALFIALVIYVFAHGITKRRIAKGWL